MIWKSENNLTLYTNSNLKYNWRMMDKFGGNFKLTLTETRRMKLNQIDDKNNEENDLINALFIINTSNPNKEDFSTVSALYIPLEKILSIQSIKLRVESITEAEQIFERVIVGSQLEVLPLYIK